MKRIFLIIITPTKKCPNLAFFSFTESPFNSLPTIKFPKNHITSSYHSNMPKTAKAKIWPLRTLGVKKTSVLFQRVQWLCYFQAGQICKKSN
jgi:hypothetical protein